MEASRPVCGPLRFRVECATRCCTGVVRERHRRDPEKPAVTCDGPRADASSIQSCTGSGFGMSANS